MKMEYSRLTRWRMMAYLEKANSSLQISRFGASHGSVSIYENRG